MYILYQTSSRMASFTALVDTYDKFIEITMKVRFLLPHDYLWRK